MQSKALKVGTDYAYNPDYRSRYSGRVSRVTVLAVGVTGVDVNGRGRYFQRESAGLVKVAFASGATKGSEVCVQPATLTKTWSEHHGEQVRYGRYAAERKRQETAERKERAEQAFALHTTLVEAGAKVGVSYVSRDEHYDALVAAGFTPAPEADFYGNPSNLHSAVNDLSTLMEKGKVDLAQVAVLLGLAEPPAPEDSLDNYDLDEEDES